MKLNKTKLFKIFKYACLIGYIGLASTLIVESCINGEESTEQSNTVGNTLADVFNDLSGDQAKLVDPTEMSITNKISEASVGDVYTIKTLVSPLNASCASNYYTSSNEEVATVGIDGRIKFLQEGKVTITATNQKFSSLYDSMNIDVHNVKAERISTSIGSASYDKNTNTYYLLDNKTYAVTTTFEPSNTTLKDVTYSTSSNEYFTIDENGVITPKCNSYNKVTEITTTHGTLSSTINVVIKKEQIIEVKDFSVSDISLYVGENKIIYPTFNPSNATYQDIKLSSDSSSINIENNSIKGLKEDTIELTVTSERYNLSKTIKVNILPQPTLESFELGINNNVVVGSKTKINLYNISPSYADVSKIEFTSTDPAVGTVENGYFVAKQVGLTTINATYEDYSTSIEINVENKIDNTTDFTLKPFNNVFNINEAYDLNSIIEVESYLPSTPSKTNLNFLLSDKSFGKITNNALFPTKAGQVDLVVTHTSSGLNKIIPIYINYACSIFENIGEEQTPITSFSLQYGKNHYFTIEDESDNNQKYEIKSSKDIYVNKSSNGKYSICSLTNESGYIEITPITGNIKHTPIFINVDMEDSTLLSLGYTLGFVALDRNMKESSLSYYPISVRSLAYIRPIAIKDSKKMELDNVYSKNITYEVEDESIAKITQEKDSILGKINPVSPGTTYVIVKDTVSNISIKIKVMILNQVIVQDAAYIINGNTLVEDGVNHYKITNGNTASLKINFNYDKTTYFDVKYHSSNPEVATINEEGVITTLKEGKTDISYICHDGISPITINGITNYTGGIEGTIHLKVERLELITDLDSFFLLVRKGVGHFGAFLVLGIFSSFTFTLFFNKKKWLWSIPLNIGQGIFLASLTEIIQLLVPGRAGLLSDVLIDVSGFIISALIISVAMIVYNFIKTRKNTPPVEEDKIIEIKEVDHK